MSQKILTIGYCRTNETLAKTLEQHLGRAGYRFRMLFGQPDETLSEQLLEDRYPLLLLVTDNFLRSSSCIHHLLATAKAKQAEGKLLVVTADGLVRDESGELRQVPTAFERVSEIIRYMNHWQDTYLDLRKTKRDTEGEAERAVEEQLTVVRDISAEVGELLRQLRGEHCVSLKTFQRDDYARFFEFTQDPEGQARLRRITDETGGGLTGGEQPLPPVEPDTDLQALIEGNSTELLLENEGSTASTDTPTVDIDTIPGMSLLNDRTAVEAPSPAVSDEDDGSAWPEAPVPLADLASDRDEADTAPPADEPMVNLQDLVAVTDDDEEELQTAEGYIDTARALLREDETERALATFREGLDVYPEHVELRYRYAVALIRRQHDMRAATQQLETLLDYDEDNVQAYFLLAEMAELHQDYLSARNYYQKVAKLDPTVPGVFYRLGMLTQHQFPNKQKKAFKYFREAIQQDPGDTDARYQYALLLWQAKDDRDNALAQLDMVLTAVPDHPFAGYDTARIHHELDNMETAREYYERAVANNPEVKTKHNDRAFGLLDDDEPDEEDQLAELHDDIERLSHRQEAAEDAEIFSVAAEPDPLPTGIAAITADNENEEESPGEEDMPADSDEAELEAEADPDWADFPDRPTVLITGATSGIGRATAVQFARAGYRLILTGRREDRLEQLKITFAERTEAEVHTLSFDVSRPFAVQEALNSLPEAWQEIDILINNAGLAAGKDPIHEGELDDWERMIDTNVKGLLYMTRAISPHMVRRRRGHIINVGSVAGKEVYPNGNVYCATKHAVDALTKAMRIDLHAHNIRVSQVAPGHVEETEFAEVRFHGDTEKAAATYDGFQPLRASDVADIIFFMATRPPHVNVQDVLVFGTQQGGATYVDRSGRPE